MKNRSVFLFGAGSSVPWDGPTTTELTNTIRNLGFKNSKGNFITDEVYNWLTTELKIKNEFVNFETILNVIEDFIHFWNFDEGYGSNGLISFISKNDKRWDLFLGFETENETDGKVDLIPFNHDEFTRERLRRVNSKQKESKFFEILYIRILSVIAGRISKYSYITKTLDKIGSSELMEKSARYFQNKYKSDFLRVYTLNYDRIPHAIFNFAKIPAFQGFHTNELIPNDYQAKLDSKGIHTRFEENCIYNLHGSICWEVENYNGDLDFFLTCGPILPDVSSSNLGNNSSEVYEIEKNRKVVISSIVSGYQKTLRTSLSPFRQMMASFDRDCLTCDEFIIAGYSFGDLHINDIIINSLKQNPQLKISIIEPCEEVVMDFLKNHSQKWNPNGVPWGFSKRSHGGKIVDYQRAKVIHYHMGIEDFYQLMEK